MTEICLKVPRWQRPCDYIENNDYQYYNNMIKQEDAIAKKLRKLESRPPCKKVRSNKNTMKYFKNINHHLRKNGHLKQPGGASCNQRR